MAAPTEYPVIILDLIQSQMGLPDDHLWLYNQKWPIPPKKSAFVVLSILGNKPFGVNVRYENDPVNNALNEVTSTQMQEMYSVQIFSQDETALQRRHEIPLALISTASQQAQEKHSFSIGRITSEFVDVSDLEGTSRLNRYALTFQVLCAYEKSRPVAYYDSFSIPPVVVPNQ